MSEDLRGPWKPAGPYVILDADGAAVAKVSGANKGAKQILIARAPALRDCLRRALWLTDNLEAASDDEFHAICAEARALLADVEDGPA